MRKLILILLLSIFALPGFGQYDVFGQYNNPFSVWGSKTKTPAGGNYVQRAWDFFNAVTAKGKTLTDAQKRWYNDSLFVPGINHGYIGTTRGGDSLVALYSFSLRWAGDSTVANMNLLDPTGSYNCIHYGGVTYTDSGVVGNGSSGYLKTGFIPSLDSSIYRLNSASIGVYSKTNLNANVRDMGGGNSSYGILIAINSTGISYQCLNNSISSSGIANNANSLGVFQLTRRGYNAFDLIINGQYKGSETINSVGLVDKPIFICAYNGNGTAGYYTSRVYSFASIGSGLSETLTKALHDDLNNALKGAGYNVY